MLEPGLRLAVMSPPECHEGARTGGLVWSDWSTWSREETVLTGGQLERVRRMEREYERRQQEIMLEAEEAVRAREEALNQELARLREELERQRSLQTDYIQDRLGGRKHEDQHHSSGSCSLQ